MAQESILDYKRLEVRKSDKADEEIITLLRNTVLGSEGGMRYTMRNTEERIAAYGSGLSFMTLYKRSNLMGVIGLCNRQTRNCGDEYESTYLRYLAIQAAFQTSAAPVRHHRTGALVEESFKQRLVSMFREPVMRNSDETAPAVPHVMYAYVESRNERSKNLINQAGYEYIRSFLTVAFSRFSPSPDRRVTLLKKEEQEKMRTLLDDQYKGYCFYTDEFAFTAGNYYVMKQEGEIIAGVTAIPACYRMVNIPGVWGWVMMKVLPVIPYYRRLFRPGEFRYLIFSSIYCRKGHEAILPDLFEAACAEEGYHTALTWLDDHSDFYEALRTNRRMGAVNRMLNAKPGLVYASFSGLTAAETEKFLECPAYISGFDFS